MNHTHITSLRRAATGAAVVLTGMAAATTPALAATTDGTSNTIQIAATSVTLDQAHNRVVVTAPSAGGLTPGMHLDRVQISTPRETLILENTMISDTRSAHRPGANAHLCKIEYPVKNPAGPLARAPPGPALTPTSWSKTASTPRRRPARKSLTRSRALGSRCSFLDDRREPPSRTWRAPPFDFRVRAALPAATPRRASPCPS